MSKQTDEKKKGKGIDLNRAVMAAKELLGLGMTEMRVQNQIDRMQLANAKADYSEDARLRTANKLRAQAEANEEKMSGLKDKHGKAIARVSNWQPLANYFNETLAHFTEKMFTTEAALEVEKFLGRVDKSLSRKLTKEQTAVVIEYYTNRAKANWDKVSQIRILLDVKGLLKKAPAKLPTEEELANIAAGQE